MRLASLVGDPEPLLTFREEALTRAFLLGEASPARVRRRQWAIGPIFICGAWMAAYSPKLQALLAPVVTSMGYELVGVEQHGGRRNGTVRVYIDSDQGVNVDDCALVSHQVSGVMDVEDPVAGNYTLEVSSPGLDRPLFVPEHFEQFQGRQAQVKLLRPLATGSRKLTGRIQSVSDKGIELEADGNTYDVSFDQIDSARLVPDYGNLTDRG